MTSGETVHDDPDLKAGGQDKALPYLLAALIASQIFRPEKFFFRRGVWGAIGENLVRFAQLKKNKIVSAWRPMVKKEYLSSLRSTVRAIPGNRELVIFPTIPAREFQGKIGQLGRRQV